MRLTVLLMKWSVLLILQAVDDQANAYAAEHQAGNQPLALEVDAEGNVAVNSANMAKALGAFGLLYGMLRSEDQAQRETGLGLLSQMYAGYDPEGHRQYMAAQRHDDMMRIVESQNGGKKKNKSLIGAAPGA